MMGIIGIMGERAKIREFNEFSEFREMKEQRAKVKGGIRKIRELWDNRLDSLCSNWVFRV